MRRARNKALAAVVAGTTMACTGGDTGGAPCESVLHLREQGALVPGLVGRMPDLDMLVGDTVKTPLADHFGPADCLALKDWHFETSSADPAAVAVSISPDLTTIEIAAHGVADSVRATVWTDWTGAPGPLLHEFFVWVRPAGS